MQIKYTQYVTIEVTRRCNMQCRHCLRGDAQNVDISNEIIDRFFDGFADGAVIETIVFSGGEITMNLDAIKYTLEVVKRKNISVDAFYMVTNGKDVEKIPGLVTLSLEWWLYCKEYGNDPDEDFSGIALSHDSFHEDIGNRARNLLSGLSYFKADDKDKDFTSSFLVNEGRAKDLPATAWKKREPLDEHLDIVVYPDGLELDDSEVYLNAVGDIVIGSDWSYDSQAKRAAVNVGTAEWPDYLLEHEYCRVDDTPVQEEAD